MSGKAKKSGRNEEKLDWESLGMNLDLGGYNPVGERLASEEAVMNDIFTEVLDVREAKIRVRSRIIDAESFFSRARNLSMFPVGQFSAAKMDALFDEGDVDDEEEEVTGEPEPDSAKSGETQLFSEAMVYWEGGHDVISYDVGGGIETKIIINRDGDKPIVSIVRSGELRNSLVLEEGRRHISVYGLKIMPIEMAVYAKKVRVEFTEDAGGVLELDYLVELRGLGIQRTKVIIEVEVVERNLKDE